MSGSHWITTERGRTSEQMSGNILVVEDNDDSRRLLSIALERAGYRVVALPDGRDVVHVLETAPIDLAILDLRLGEGPDGFRVARSISAMSDVPMIFLSAASSLEDRLAAFDVGSEDYLTKPVSPAELLARVDAVLRRTQPHRNEPVLVVDDVTIDLRDRRVTRNGADVPLTKTELGLFAELVRRRGRVVSKRELLTRVWGYADYDENVVEVALSSLRKKLEREGPRVIETVRGVGYIVRE